VQKYSKVNGSRYSSRSHRLSKGWMGKPIRISVAKGEISIWVNGRSLISGLAIAHPVKAGLVVDPGLHVEFRIRVIPSDIASASRRRSSNSKRWLKLFAWLILAVTAVITSTASISWLISLSGR